MEFGWVQSLSPALHVVDEARPEQSNGKQLKDRMAISSLLFLSLFLVSLLFSSSGKVIMLTLDLHYRVTRIMTNVFTAS